MDASYSIHWDSKGHSGMVIGLGDSCCIMARSVKQKLVARSSTESELIALDDALCYILWFRKLLEDLGFKQFLPLFGKITRVRSLLQAKDQVTLGRHATSVIGTTSSSKMWMKEMSN